MKRIILILFALLLMAGGVVGGMVFLNIGPFAGLVEGARPDLSAALSLKPPAPSYMDLPPFVIPIFIEDKPVRNIYLVVRLDVDYKVRRDVDKYQTRIRDAIIQDLHTFLPAHLKTRDAVDFEIVRQRLLRVADRVTGTGKIKGVLINTAYDRPH